MLAKHYHRTLMALALLTASANMALAQAGVITGRITDAQSKQPLPDVNLMVLRQTETVARGVTRPDGTYRIGNVAPGEYILRARKPGYAANSSPLRVPTDRPVTLDLELTMQITNLEQVVTTTGRGEEKEAISTPQSVAVVDAVTIQERPSVTVADHIQGLAGVDVSRGGVAQSNVVARGFNNAFSGSLLTLQDYRFAGVPSLRVNVPFMATATNEDVERVEVVLGPASALFGPNSSKGVVHVITKSPFASQGTTLTVDGGTKSLFRGSLRHAAVLSDNVALKLSGEYFTATDWRYNDPGEPDVFPQSAPAGRRGLQNDRNFDVNRWTAEARLDVRPTANSEYITTLGQSSIGSAIEYTGANGTAQVKDWTYRSLQQRMRVGRFFAQAFMNFSNAGNDDATSLDGTYLLRSGQPIVDQSRMWAAQMQHGISLGSRQDFVYGFDYIFTNPRTGNTINGRNEDIDDVTEYGGYLQSTTNLTDRWDLVGAIRIDKNDQIDGTQFSPRVGLVYKLGPSQNFRATYNRAFSTPGNFTWFLDLIQASNIAGLPYNVRALGNPPKKGWSFRRDCEQSVSGGLCMRTIFTGPAGEGTWQPASAAVAYRGVIAGNATAIAAGLVPAIQQIGATQAQAQALANALVQYMGGLQPTPAQVGTEIRFLGQPATNNLTPDQVQDIGPLGASFNNTYELGYKGIIGNKLRVAIDLWQEKRGDVGNPAGLATPSIYFNRASLQTYLSGQLTPYITGVLMQQFGMPQAQAQATATVVAGQIGTSLSTNFAPLPLGIIQFDSEIFANARDMYATYTSYNKEITVKGADLAVDYVLSDAWTVGMSYSWVSDLIFPGVTSSNSQPLMLNAPDNKATATAQYRNIAGKWGLDIRTRYTNAYPVNSGVYASGVTFPRPGTNETYVYDAVHAATIVDLGFNKRFMAGGRDLLFSVRADNLLDTEYQTMPGTPLLGRMVVTRLQYHF